MATTIGVLNKSKKISIADARLMTRACQLQLKRDVAPAWERVPWKVRFYRYRSQLPKNCIAIVLFDDADEADTLGYHTEDEDVRQFRKGVQK